MFFKKKASFLGLDIGSSSIKLVELKLNKKNYELINFGSVPIPSETIVDGAILASSTVVDGISNLISSLKIKTKDVVTSVSGHSVIVKKIVLPTTTSQELANSIQWEAEQYIPFDISDVYIDFQILGPSKEDPDLMDVMLVAAKIELVNDYVAAIKDAGLNPVIVDVDCFAIQNAFEYNYGILPDEIVALVNIGANVMNINILRDGISSFTRDIAIGGKQITEELQKQLNIDFETAEAAKVGMSVEGIQKEEVGEVVKNAVVSISTEIQRSLDFFSASAGHQEITKVYLFGGCVKVHEIVLSLEEKLNIPVEIVNSFNRIEVNPKNFDPQYLAENSAIAGVSVGLALRVGD